MLAEEYDYIKGNTAVVPKRKIEERDLEKEKKERQIKEDKKREKLRKEKTKGFVSMLVVMAILGALSLSIDTYVYKTQKALTSLEAEIKEQTDIKDALNIQLLKVSSLDNINDVAINELNMLYPDKTSIKNIDMSKDYFTHLKEDNKESSAKKNTN